MLRLLLALSLKFLLICFVVRRALEHGCGDLGAGMQIRMLYCGELQRNDVKRYALVPASE